MGLFRSSPRPGHAAGAGESAAPREGFPYLGADEVYLDAACQSLRPQPVLDAMAAYATGYPACGDRVAYAWGARVSTEVDAVRTAALAAFGLSPRRHSCAFTLNTTYGINLLLQQLPAGRYARVVTSHAEHNAVFLSTMTAAARLGIPRVVVDRVVDAQRGVAHLDLDGVDLTDAVVVVSAMDNVTGTPTADLAGVVTAARARGGIVIVDAAQAAPHARASLHGLAADALCFSSHKMSGPALGVVLASNSLLGSLEPSFVGGGQVASVSEAGFEPLAALHSRLEPGLQAWESIIGFGAALAWAGARADEIAARERRLGVRLFDGLTVMPHLRMFTPAASTVVSVVPERVDAHRLAVFLSKAGIMARSGHFCAHHWLDEREHLPALLRFSVGAHSTDGDVDRALEVMSRMMKGL